jgi:hypothetical protein
MRDAKQYLPPTIASFPDYMDGIPLLDVMLVRTNQRFMDDGEWL